jgi:hypothetical protein
MVLMFKYTKNKWKKEGEGGFFDGFLLTNIFAWKKNDI